MRLPQDSLAFAFFQAAQIVGRVMGGQSLGDGLLARVPGPARPAVQDYVYSSLRNYGRGDFFLQGLLKRPLAEASVHALLLVALGRLEQRPEHAHTVVDQAVQAAAELLDGRFKSLVNAVLRNFLRGSEALLQAADNDELARNRHPDWWLERLRRAYPNDWERLVVAGNQPPPMGLRVNQRAIAREHWLANLNAGGGDGKLCGRDGVLLARPLPVEQLPGFFDGWVSVQDIGAQRAADLLNPSAGSRVLDACAAPGGKTAHLLERTDIELTALDLKPSRCRRIEENLSRLGLQARVQVADCAKLDTWWNGQPFDAILADVPCTASGVVRRHPDVKWLRRESDIASFARTQATILDTLWQLLQPGGRLLYATCSLFPEENELQIARFLNKTQDSSQCYEELLLPDAEHDGFYYCLVEKRV